MENPNNNPFDFTDLSDLPADLAQKLDDDTTADVRAYADIVNKGADAGFPSLTIAQIMAVAIRSGMEVPTQATVRAYLNKAEKMNLIIKPTRMTYGAIPSNTPVDTPVEDTPVSAPVEEDDDVLAGIAA